MLGMMAGSQLSTVLLHYHAYAARRPLPREQSRRNALLDMVQLPRTSPDASYELLTVLPTTSRLASVQGSAGLVLLMMTPLQLATTVSAGEYSAAARGEF